MSKEQVICGIDIGGSHITSALVGRNGLLKETKRESAIDAGNTSEYIYNGWANCINKTTDAVDQTNLAGYSFAMPNPFNYKEGIALFDGTNAKFGSLYGNKIQSLLMPLLRKREGLHFRYINDATAFALGEAHFGAGTPSLKTINITLGTGFGSAFIDKGLPIFSGIHVPNNGMLWDFPIGDRIAEDFISTRWFVKRCQELFDFSPKGVKEIAEKAASKNHYIQIFEEFAKNLVSILTPWITKFEADAIIIGGNISNAFKLFEIPLRNYLELNRVKIPIYTSKLGEDAALLGSSLLFNPTTWDSIRNHLPEE